MLLLVYNADAGSLNAILDSAHKLLSPATYQCKLCQLTYGLVRETEAWKAFRRNSPEAMTFLHRDEHEQQHAERFDYPFIARVDEDNRLNLLLSSDDLNKIASTEALIDAISGVMQQS